MYTWSISKVQSRASTLGLHCSQLETYVGFVQYVPHILRENTLTAIPWSMDLILHTLWSTYI
jgi:hypothetical protein